MLFGKKRNRLFIQEANARSRRKGTMGTFGRWCRRNHLDVGGKVSLRCINKAKRSGNTKLIRRAVYAQNIKAYAGARKRRSGFGRDGCGRFQKMVNGKCVNKSAKSIIGNTVRGVGQTASVPFIVFTQDKDLERKVFRSEGRKYKAFKEKEKARKEAEKAAFGKRKKKKTRKIPNNKKLGFRIKGYSGKEHRLSVFVKINGKMYKPRVSKGSKKGYFKVTIKRKKYQFKSKGPESYVTLTAVRKSSFGARTRPRRCKRLPKRKCRSDPQCRWSGRRKGQRVKHRCVRRRKVYEGPALSFGKRNLRSKFRRSPKGRTVKKKRKCPDCTKKVLRAELKLAKEYLGRINLNKVETTELPPGPFDIAQAPPPPPPPPPKFVPKPPSTPKPPTNRNSLYMDELKAKLKARGETGFGRKYFRFA